MKLHSGKKKQTDDEILIGKAVKATIQILYDKGLFHNYDNADEVLKNYLITDEDNERRRPDSEEINDVFE